MFSYSIPNAFLGQNLVEVINHNKHFRIYRCLNCVLFHFKCLETSITRDYSNNSDACTYKKKSQEIKLWSFRYS